MNKTISPLAPTRSELVTKHDALEEKKKAILEKMANSDLPIDSDSYNQLVQAKNKIVDEIVAVEEEIAAMNGASAGI